MITIFPPSTTQILLPESEQNGDVTFNVVTSDQENDPIDILATYSLDGGFTWNSGSTEIINSQLTYSSETGGILFDGIDDMIQSQDNIQLEGNQSKSLSVRFRLHEDSYQNVETGIHYIAGWGWNGDGGQPAIKILQLQRYTKTEHYIQIKIICKCGE